MMGEKVLIKSNDLDTGLVYLFNLTKEDAVYVLNNLHLEHLELHNVHVYPRVSTLFIRNFFGGGGTAILDKCDIIRQIESQLKILD